VYSMFYKTSSAYWNLSPQSENQSYAKQRIVACIARFVI